MTLAQGVAGLFFGAVNNINAALETKRAFKAEPRTPISVITERNGFAIPELIVQYNGLEIASAEVITRRLAEAVVDEVKLGDYLTTKELQHAEDAKTNFFSHIPYGTQRIVDAFALSTGSKAVDLDSTMRKITLGSDPYNGKDYYPNSRDPLTGRLSDYVFYSAASLDDLNATIELAQSQLKPSAIESAPEAP